VSGWLARRRWGWEAIFAVLAAMAAYPLWVVDHPPIQDLPQHLAATRVLFDFSDPALAFERTFEIDLFRTQYLGYYLANYLLAFVFGVELANRVLLTLAIVLSPYAMRSLLVALDRDERLALFVLPLTWNAHLILGFLNFIAAIPLALFGLALAVRLSERFDRRRAIGLAVVAVIAFYTHVVPFAFLGLGATLVAVGGGWKPTALRLAPLVPAGLAAIVWSRTSPAGSSTLTAAFSSGDEAGGPVPQFMAAGDALRQIPEWLTDILHDEADEQLLVAHLLLVLFAITLGVGRRAGEDATSRDEATKGSLARRLAVLAPLAALLYFVTPASYDWIWPINTRFPLLALVFLVPLLPRLRGALGVAILAAVAAISVTGDLRVAEAFERFEEHEVAELDEALDAIPEGRRVAGLVFDRGSREVKFSPFIHAAAWYQARKGGAVMFTFADFPQSPFRFREDDRPPRVGPRWEWMPERVRPATDLAWYEYVLVRGGPGTIAAMPTLYEPVFRGPHWSVWRRIGPAP
jgi:hypothetical protein